MSEIGQGAISLLQGVRRRGYPDGYLRGDLEELDTVLARIGCHAPQCSFLEQVAFVVEYGDVGQIDAGNGEGSPSVQGSKRGGDQTPDRCEEYGGVERLGR